MDVRRGLTWVVLVVCLVGLVLLPDVYPVSGESLYEPSAPVTPLPGVDAGIQNFRSVAVYEERLLRQAEAEDTYGFQDADRTRFGSQSVVTVDDSSAFSGPSEGQSSAGALGIYGHVTLNGVNVGSVTLELRYYDGSSWTTRATTTTAADGNYRFLGVPSLTTGQRYYVRFLNDEAVAGRLYSWSTTVLTAYNGEDVHIGDFDIADVGLVTPSDGGNPGLPKTFQWTMRSGVPTDNYELNLFDLSDSAVYWYMTVGYLPTHVVSCLPNKFSTGTTYGWYMGVYSPDGGYGNSYYYRQLTFKNNPACNGIRGHAGFNGANAADLNLELRFWDGSVWSTRGNAISAADGSYKFVNVPSLAAGQEYYVRFSNYDGNASQLWRWWTISIDAYTYNTNASAGDFDIADIALVQPANQDSITLPYTFQWTPRTATPTDAYELDLFNPVSGALQWAGVFGYVGSYSLGCFWPDLKSGSEYGWSLWAIAPDGSYGQAYYYRLVTLSDGPECTHNYLPLTIR